MVSVLTETALVNLRRALAPMNTCQTAWWVAGGWALDLFLGRMTRPHHDVDVAILRVAWPSASLMSSHSLRDKSQHWLAGE